jgi:hypothetical protein
VVARIINLAIATAHLGDPVLALAGSYPLVALLYVAVMRILAKGIPAELCLDLTLAVNPALAVVAQAVPVSHSTVFKTAHGVVE